jgi:hypothetical protein
VQEKYLRKKFAAMAHLGWKVWLTLARKLLHSSAYARARREDCAIAR